MAQDKRKLWYLKNLDVFSHLRDEEHRMIDENSTMREVKRKDVLYFEGSQDDNVYILKSGAVKIAKHTPQGNELILDILSNGSIFGEMSAVEPGEKDETAVVVEDGLICTMKKENFDRMVQIVPGLAVKITKMRGLKMWRIENKLLDLLYCTVEQRLAKTLLNLLEDFGVPHGEGYLVQLKLTHKDFADLIGSTRETVTATLGKLKERGTIDYEGKYVIIKSMQGLQALAD